MTIVTTYNSNGYPANLFGCTVLSEFGAFAVLERQIDDSYGVFFCQVKRDLITGDKTYWQICPKQENFEQVADKFNQSAINHRVSYRFTFYNSQYCTVVY